MEKKSVGRNTKLSIADVRKIIKMFKENVQPIGDISYSEIHRYANQLYYEGKVSASTSDSFWRKHGRLGRGEVDKANEVFSEIVTNSKDEKIKVPNVVDLINKKYKNKEDLLKTLIFMEKQFHETLAREKKLKKKILSLEENLEKTKSDRKRINETNDNLQGLVYRLFRILSETPIQEVQQKTEYAIKTVFSSPASFFDFDARNQLKAESSILPFEKDEAKNKFSNRFRKS